MRILDGFGEHFGRVLEGFGSPGGVQMDMKIDTCRRKFRSCPQDPPREALGRVLGGFGEVWGRFWDGLERFSDVFLIDFRFPGGFLGILEREVEGVSGKPS